MPNPLEQRGEQIADAMYEMRVLYALPPEQRAGAKFSGTTLTVLKAMYADIQKIDNLVDSWIPQLAELLGVPNTDADDGTGKPDESNDDAPIASTATDGRAALRDLEEKRKRQRQQLEDRKRKAS